jgi:membrane associated rhomboid family serine protease
MLGLIPIHDDNPTRRPAVVTWSLIAVNVVVFLLLEPVSPLSLSGSTGSTAQLCRQFAFFREYAAIPQELTSNRQLDEPTAGAPAGRGQCEAVEPDYVKIPLLSVLTAMFLHGGLLHLLGNMLFLFVFGNNVEDRLGRVRYLLFYLACGYLATYGFALSQPSSEETLVGASGAIAGVLGAYLVLFPRARVTSLIPFLFFIPIWLPAWVVLGSWFVLQWLYVQGAGTAEGAGVAYLAHVVGFVAGVLLVILLGGLQQRRRPPPSPPPTWDYRHR